MDKKLKIGIIAGSVLLYLFIALYYIHIRLVMIEEECGIAQGITEGLNDTFRRPFSIFPLPEGCLTEIFFTTILIGFFALMFITSSNIRKHYNNEKALGSSKFMTQKYLDDYNRRFTEPFGSTSHDGKNNMILSREMFQSLDNMGIAKHNNYNGRNVNVAVIGGSGAGKTFGLVGPNILQANCNYIITDPSGELFRDYSWFLENEGYRVKCFNLDHMDRGNHYNPFNYIHSDKDIEVLVTTLISSTTPPEKNGGDPFWEKSETALLNALIAYLYHYCIPSTRNFSQVMELLRAAEIDENDSSFQSPLDIMMQQIEERDPDGFCIKQWKNFKMGAGKTLKSILISIAVRLQAFDLEDVAELTNTDDIDLDSVGDEKTAIFVIIPTGEKTFNFLASLMYSQLFQRMYGYAENTSMYSMLVKNEDGEVIRTFRAENEKDMERARNEAEEFLDKYQDARIKYDKDLALYIIEARDRSILGYARIQEYADRFLLKMLKGRIERNPKARLPIHVRMLLDEFANIPTIPDFDTKVATVRKYEVSVTIILQSLNQMQKLYEKDWESIIGNCDNTIYLGGGADKVTFEWMSNHLGKETRVVQGLTFNGGSQGGSMSLNKQGVELMAQSEIRTLKEDECIVLPKSLDAYKGKKFPASLHKNWKYVSETPKFLYDARRMAILAKEWKQAAIPKSIKLNQPKYPKPKKETEQEEKQRQKRNEEEKRKAEEYRDNRGIDKERVINPPKEVEKSGSKYVRESVKANSEKEVKEVIESLVAIDNLEGLLNDEDIEFDSITF
jgi:Type IV secretory pathway, VirD4 components